jgi:hypothetical protein
VASLPCRVSRVLLMASSLRTINTSLRR